jgi:hypothetical protein
MISVKNRKEIRIETAIPYTDNVLDWYRDRDQVRIMNIHLESSNFQLSVRDLAQCSNTCQASLNQTEEKNANPQINGLPTNCCGRGRSWFVGTVKFNRTRVVQYLEQYQEKLESRPLPLECMDQVSLEALLAESMRLERELVPDFTRLMRNSIERTSGMPQPRTSSVLSTQQQC